MRETTNYQFTKTISQRRFGILTYLFTYVCSMLETRNLETLIRAVCCSLAEIRRLVACSAAGPRYCYSVVVQPSSSAACYSYAARPPPETLTPFLKSSKATNRQPNTNLETHTPFRNLH